MRGTHEPKARQETQPLLCSPIAAEDPPPPALSSSFTANGPDGEAYSGATLVNAMPRWQPGEDRSIW